MEIHSTQRSKRSNAMSRQIFSVVIVQGEWTISHGGKYHGSFPTQKVACRAAIDMAHNTAGDSLVMLHGVDGKFKTEWTYGHDPYPPNG
jgi:hypothetical protein